MSTTIPVAFDLYLDKLITEAHGPEVPQSLREEMASDLYGRLQNHLLASLIQALPDSEADAFGKFMATAPAEDDVQKFFEEHIPQCQDVVAESLLEFRDVYVGSIKSL